MKTQHAAMGLTLLFLFLFASAASAGTVAPVRPVRPVGPDAKVRPVARPEALIRWEEEKWPDGKLKKRTPYKGDKIHGTVEEYATDGKLRAKTPYVEGVMEGVAETFFANGNIETKIPYKAGKIDGVAEQYWDVPFVAIQSKITYVSGLKHGPMTTWHHNGNVLNERTYKDDKLDGADLQYHPTSSQKKVKVQRYWKDGLQTDSVSRYDDQGRMLSYETWEDGKQHGCAYVCGLTGEVRVQEEWNRGALVSRAEMDYFNLAGGEKKLKQSESFNNAHKLHGKCSYYSAPDKLEKVLAYENGQLHGTCEFYDADGKLIRREQWVNGKQLTSAPVNVVKPPKGMLRKAPDQGKE